MRPIVPDTLPIMQDHFYMTVAYRIYLFLTKAPQSGYYSHFTDRAGPEWVSNLPKVTPLSSRRVLSESRGLLFAITQRRHVHTKHYTTQAPKAAWALLWPKHRWGTRVRLFYWFQSLDVVFFILLVIQQMFLRWHIYLVCLPQWCYTASKLRFLSPNQGDRGEEVRSVEKWRTWEKSKGLHFPGVTLRLMLFPIRQLWRGPLSTLPIRGCWSG